MRGHNLFINSEPGFEKDLLDTFIRKFHFFVTVFGKQTNSLAYIDNRITSDFELIYVTNGKMDITINRENIVCEKGDIILIPPFVQNSIYPFKSMRHSNYWIHFEVTPFYAHQEFMDSILPSGERKVQVGLLPELLQTYERLMKEATGGKAGYRLYTEALFTQIYIILLRVNKTYKNIDKGRAVVRKSEKDLIDKCTEFIYNHLSESIKIKDICSSLYVSESYLLKVFHKVLNLPPSSFIQMIKIKRAEQLLKLTSYSVRHISEMLGFSSPYHFSNTFKKYYNISPKEFRKRYIKI